MFLSCDRSVGKLLARRLSGDGSRLGEDMSEQ